MTREMDTVVTTTQKFLSTLIEKSKSTNHNQITASKVTNLIQELIDGKLNVEDFSKQLQNQLTFYHPLTEAIRNLEETLPRLRQALATEELTIDGITPPPNVSLIPTCVQPKATCTPKRKSTMIVGQQKIATTVSPNISRKRSKSKIEKPLKRFPPISSKPKSSRSNESKKNLTVNVGILSTLPPLSMSHVALSPSTIKDAQVQPISLPPPVSTTSDSRKITMDIRKVLLTKLLSELLNKVIQKNIAAIAGPSTSSRRQSASEADEGNNLSQSSGSSATATKISPAVTFQHEDTNKEIPNNNITINEDLKEESIEQYMKRLDKAEPSKFNKHGDVIYKLLKTELKSISNPNALKRKTRLNDYQIEAVLKTAEYFEENSSNGEISVPALIVAPPGSGKTGMVTMLPFVLKSQKILIVTPSFVISNQIANAFGKRNKEREEPFFLKSGICQTEIGFKNLSETPYMAKNSYEVGDIADHKLVILNAQKLGGRSKASLNRNQDVRKDINDFDTVIIDEAHHYPADTWKEIVDCFKNKRVIMLTATPFRMFNGTPIHMKDQAKLEVAYEIEKNVLEGVTIRKLEFDEKVAQLSIQSKKPDFKNEPLFIEQLKRDIQEILEKHKTQEPRMKCHQALIIVRTKSEAMTIASRFGDIATYIVSGRYEEDNLAMFSRGEKQIATVCDKLREGYDNSNVTLCVILRNCQSRVFFEQFCGRALRMNRDLTGKTLDRTIGTILSYDVFAQRQMWDSREFVSETEPFDEELTE